MPNAEVLYSALAAFGMLKLEFGHKGLLDGDYSTLE